MEEKIRILLLENVAADAEMNVRALDNEGLKYESRLATNKGDFEKALSEFRPDIILADYRLPDFTGLDALRIVQERKLSAPVIIVTGSLDEETAVDLIKEGAANYVIKQHLVRLGPAVRGALEKMKLTEENDRAQKALQEAYRDLELKVRQRTADLENSEKAYRDLVENVNSVILTTDRAGTITFINNFGLNFFGFARKELVGKNVLGTIVPEKESTGRDMRKMVAGIMVSPDSSQVNINENVKRNGERVWMSWANRAVKDDAGNITGVFTVGNDITQIKEAQRLLSDALKEARRRADQAEEGKSILDSIMSNIPEGIMVTDADGKIRMISDYMARITGVSPEEAKSKTVDIIDAKLDAADEAAKPYGFPIIRALKRGETILSEEHTVHASDGTTLTVLVNAQPVKSADGTVIGALTSWRDITERKKSEDTLRRNEYELRTLVDNSPDLIFRMNRQMQYVYANPAYERLTGILRGQLIGKTNKELGMSQQLVEFWQSALRDAMESGREHSIEFDLTSFFGKRHFFARLIPEFAKSGVVDTVLVIARDITERKRAEERIRYISFHDEVTGLFNRAFFEEEIRRVDAGRDLPISIIMGDVNNLKLSNDVFGHDEGDKLLKAIADVFRKACRQNDIIARWGGDEFAVILPKTDRAAADEVCRRIRDTAAGSKGTVIQPSLALGVAAKENKDQNIYPIIRRAEEMMYQNKLAESAFNENSVIAALTGRVQERTNNRPRHIDTASDLARRLGKELGLDEDQMKCLLLLVQMHDVGKSALPVSVLNKPGRLSKDEWDMVKRHPEAGFRIVKSFPDTAKISDEVLSQDERWDGSGYPRGLKGREIPYIARVFSIVRAYDAMTSSRPYAQTFTPEQAIEELRRNAGSQFDPELTEVFITRVASKTEEPVKA